MAKVNLLIKCNCRNNIFIEGLVDGIKKFQEIKEGFNPREMLTFSLTSTNVDYKDRTYHTEIQVTLKNNRAISVGKWIKEGQFVEVEGILRALPDDGFNIEGVYVSDATPDMRLVEIIEEEGAK